MLRDAQEKPIRFEQEVELRGIQPKMPRNIGLDVFYAFIFHVDRTNDESRYQPPNGSAFYLADAYRAIMGAY